VVAMPTGQLAARAFFYVAAALNLRDSPQPDDFDRRRHTARRRVIAQLAAGVVAPPKYTTKFDSSQLQVERLRYQECQLQVVQRRYASNTESSCPPAIRKHANQQRQVFGVRHTYDGYARSIECGTDRLLTRRDH
jgi:hypothetical protein